MLEERLVKELVISMNNVIRLLYNLEYDYIITYRKDSIRLELLTGIPNIYAIELPVRRNDEFSDNIEYETIKQLTSLEQYLIIQNNNTITEDF